MTVHELTDLLGQVNGKYIQEAAEPIVQRKKKSKVWMMIAAAAVLALAGCAAAIMGLQDRVVGQEQFESYGPTGSTVSTQNVISLFGYRGSPNHQATEAWYSFLKTYAPEGKLLNEDAMGNIPENYQISYGCYTQEMVTQVNAIAARYGLQVMGALEVAQKENEDIFYKTLGIEGLCRKEADAEARFGGAYFYPEGAFKADLDITMTGENALWKDTVWSRVFYTKKGCFDPKTVLLGQNPYEEWMYTTTSGQRVLIAMDETGAYIFAEQPDAYMTVSVSTETFENMGHTDRPSREKMEQLADVYDFSITPHAPENMEKVREALHAADEAAANVPEEGITYQNVKNFTEFLLDYNRWTNGMAYYCLMDINGDGEEELLLGPSTEHFGEAVINLNGVLTQYFTANGSSLCEGQVIKEENDYPDGSHEICYYSYKNIRNTEDRLEPLDWLKYDAAGKRWSYSKGSCGENAQEISEDKANEIMARYTVIPVELQPILSFPVGDATLEEAALQNTNALSEDEILGLYAEPIRKNQETGMEKYKYYMLKDITGDGVPELFAGSKPDIAVDIFTVENGKLRTISFWQSIRLHENQILETLSTPPEAERHTFFEVKDGALFSLERIEEIRGTGKYCRTTAENPAREEITVDEFAAVMDSYGAVKMDMKPISEFPMP